jgi:hypothetical protein
MRNPNKNAVKNDFFEAFLVCPQFGHKDNVLYAFLAFAVLLYFSRLSPPDLPLPEKI